MKVYLIPLVWLLASPSGTWAFTAPPAGAGQDRLSVEDAVTALRGLIQKQQRLHVRESYGELAHQCFTAVDLDEFKRAGKPARIARGLRDAKEVAGAVSALRGLSQEQRTKLLATCRTALRPTWARLGRISGEGQTLAGNQAERMIADAIVDMVVQLIGPAADSANAP